MKLFNPRKYDGWPTIAGFKRGELRCMVRPLEDFEEFERLTGVSVQQYVDSVVGRTWDRQ